MPDSVIEAIVGEELKYCPKCKTLKPLSEFHKNKAAKDGVQHICKKCRSEMDRERHKELKELQKKAADSQPKPVEVIKTVDGRTLVKRESSEEHKPLSKYEPRELFAELKRRGYVWADDSIYVKQYVNYDKI